MASTIKSRGGRGAVRLGAVILVVAASADGTQLASARVNPDSTLPSILRDEAQPSSLPYWVSARVALDDSGRLRADLLGQLRNEWDRMSARGEIAKSGCLEQGPVYGELFSHQVPVSTLAKLQANSIAVVRGTVAAYEYGFESQHAGTLIRLDPIEVIAGDATAKDAPLFILYPKAIFTLGSFSFCKIDPRASHQPGIGDEVLVLSRTAIGGVDRRIVGFIPGGHFLETHDGTLVVPDSLRNDPVVDSARTLDEIVAALRTAKASR